MIYKKIPGIGEIVRTRKRRFCLFGSFWRGRYSIESETGLIGDNKNVLKKIAGKKESAYYFAKIINLADII